MTADLIIKGGLIADGTGLPAYRSDLIIKDGRITRIGHATEDAPQIIDADGLVVAPGFIDLHTHYDAQLHFEPLASPSSWHGVTTVIIGQCGFSLAPSKPEDVSWLMQMLSRVEGMSPDALAEGVDFSGGSLADFFKNIEGRIGVNCACFAGHAAIRRKIMGEDASQRAATSKEIESMKALLEQSMQDGAIGFSSSQLKIHADHLGRPVPPNWATPEELITLAGVISTFNNSMLAFFPESMGEGYLKNDRELMLAMSEASGYKPLIANPLTLNSRAPDTYLRSIEFLDEASESGHRIHPQFMMPLLDLVWSLDSTFVFDEMPTFRQVLSLSGEARINQLKDSSVRNKMREELADTSNRMLVFDWADVRITSVQNEQHKDLLDLTIRELATRRNTDVFDALLDLSISEELKTVFSLHHEVSTEVWNTTKALIEHPLPLAGSSDGGAHLLSFCGGDYTTRLLTDAVPEVLTLEQAVSRLSYQPAMLAGLWDRGMIKPGNVADIVLFDPKSLGVKPLSFRQDFPAGAQRAVIEATGYRYLIVGGEILLQNGEDTGVRPGKVLRRSN